MKTISQIESDYQDGNLSQFERDDLIAKRRGKDWSIFEGTPKPGPFPLQIEKQGERLAVVTSQGNLFASTFCPMAARWIAALPELKQALEDFVLLADIEENSGPLANQARAALAKLKGGAL
jgi:hypothetical protein